MQHDAPRLRLITRYRLVKWDGDPPGPGEHKEPAEIIEGEIEEEVGNHGTDQRI